MADPQLRARGESSRDYLWAWITTATTPGEYRWLLIRRNRTTGELAFYLCWSPRPVPLHTLVRVAGTRWSIEELVQTGKGQVGMPEGVCGSNGVSGLSHWTLCLVRSVP